MVLQTTTRGVGRVQKIQNGTILEKIKKNLKRHLLSQNGEKRRMVKKGESGQQKAETTFKMKSENQCQSEKFN